MKSFFIAFICLTAALSISFSTSFTQSTYHSNNSSQLESVKALFPDNSTTISGQWFLKFQSGELHSEKFSHFIVTRGYITINKKLTQNISARITPDISIDKEGDGKGDVEMRLKYCYIQFKLPDFAFFSIPTVRFGIIHNPWLQYEQKINRYRIQGTMYLQRYRTINSADAGIVFSSNIGGEFKNRLMQKNGISNNGKYGSFAIGLFNGSGYHGIENNSNKTIEGRLSIRPFYNFLPGLQLSYIGAYGKGNTEFEPPWKLNACFVSFEHKFFAVTGTYYQGLGNTFGSFVDDSNNSTDQGGFSIFGDLKLLNGKVSLFGRYEKFDFSENFTTDSNERTIVGIAHHLYKKSKLLFDYDVLSYPHSDKKKDSVFEFAVEVNF
jgi:hypothetical protein